jgi:hypothetical protein
MPQISKHHQERVSSSIHPPNLQSDSEQLQQKSTQIDQNPLQPTNINIYENPSEIHQFFQSKSIKTNLKPCRGRRRGRRGLGLRWRAARRHWAGLAGKKRPGAFGSGANPFFHRKTNRKLGVYGIIYTHVFEPCGMQPQASYEWENSGNGGHIFFFLQGH